MLEGRQKIAAKGNFISMRLKNNSHVMYCLNIHPGEHLDEILASIENSTLRVKEKVCPDAYFGLGLRLSYRAAQELSVRLKDFLEFLKGNRLYVVTVNGFPFGLFHGTRVKEKVYLPDWTSVMRLDYTLKLAEILACLLPEGETGTMSTVPSHFGKKEEPLAVSNLLMAVAFLREIERRTGKHIILSLEPEPGCYLDSLDSVIHFFKNIFRIDKSAREYLGVCLDCCHIAVEFESPLVWFKRLRECGIEVTKIQISSALRAENLCNPHQILLPFYDKVHLHQVHILSEQGIVRFRDLPEALDRPFRGEWRIHFHVPLTWSGDEISSTTSLIEDDFFRQIASTGKRHVEVETYSYEVLPGTKLPLIDSITSELEWLKEKFDRVIE